MCDLDFSVWIRHCVAHALLACSENTQAKVMHAICHTKAYHRATTQKGTAVLVRAFEVS